MHGVLVLLVVRTPIYLPTATLIREKKNNGTAPGYRSAHSPHGSVGATRGGAASGRTGGRLPPVEVGRAS
jgi:hypothetical protein